jgi:phage terminase small subunit
LGRGKGREVSLTPKQEEFVRAYVDTSCASTAYRRAYNAEGMKDNSIHVNACKLLKSAKVALRINELQERATKTAVLDRAWVLERLMRNADKGAEMDDLTASNKALELLGKTEELQMFIEKSKSDITTDGKPMVPVLNVSIGRTKS